MPALHFRDTVAGREVLFPWPVPDAPMDRTEPLVKETGAGRCALFTNAFGDGSLAVGLLYPGGARFARFPADPHEGHEEAFEGSPPESIREEMAKTWKDTIALFAARQAELRLAVSPEGGPDCG